MISIGTTVRNESRGDTITFLSTEADQASGKLKLRVTLLAACAWQQAHYHTGYDEQLRVTNGTLVLKLGKKRHLIDPSHDVQVIPRGVVHSLATPASGGCTFEVVISPTFELGGAIWATYRLAAERRLNCLGLPRNPLYLGLMLECLGTYVPWLPRFVQDATVRALSGGARLLGQSRHFSEYMTPVVGSGSQTTEASEQQTRKI